MGTDLTDSGHELHPFDAWRHVHFMMGTANLGHHLGLPYYPNRMHYD